MRKLPKPKKAAGRTLAQPSTASRSPKAVVSFDTALAYHQQGKFAEAKAIYQQILRDQPAHLDALKMLATIAAQSNESQLAIDLFDQVLALRPADATTLNNRGIALVNLDRLDEARASFEQALKLKPDDINTQQNLANVLNTLGDFKAAAEHYRKVATAMPTDAAAHQNLAVVLQALGEYAEAMASYQMAINLAPANLEARNKLGTMFKETGHTEEAIDCFRKALAIAPDNDEIIVNLGNALRESGQLDEAEKTYRHAIAINPECVEAFNNLGSLLSALGRLDEAVSSFRQALAKRPDFVSAHSNLLFMYQYLPNLDQAVLAEELRRFGELVEQNLKPYTDWPKANSTVGDNPQSLNLARPLRVGFVSGDLRQHPVGNFLQGALEALAKNARGRLEIYAYANHFQFDDVSKHIKASCHTWRFVNRLSDTKLAEKIRDDGIDVLIDLSGHSGHNRLPALALKPAPVQATWLGYLGSTGLRVFDYLIADAWTLPDTIAQNFTEKIWHLPDCYLCFTEPADAPEVNALPALANGYLTFGCFNNLTKMNDEVVAVWARVLHRVPESRLYLKAKQFVEASAKKSVIERFARHGIARKRLILKNLVPRKNYLEPYNELDIALDPFPYPGITTSVESLFMGVPVLSLAGESFLSLQGLGILSNVDLPDWVTHNVDDYVDKAVAYANDLTLLTKIRKQLRPRVLKSVLFDTTRFAAHFEQALFGMWNEIHNQKFGDSTVLPSAPRNELTADRRKQLIEHFRAGRATELEQEARAFVTQDAQSGFGWKMLGAALLLKNRPALVELQTASRLLPDDADVHNNLAAALHAAQAFAEAISSYQRALEIRPNDAQALHNLSISLSKLGRFAEAASACRRANEIDPRNAAAFISLALAQRSLGQLDDAVRSVGQALEITPQDAGQHVLLGDIHWQCGLLDQAIACYRQAIALRPTLVEAHRSLGKALHFCGRSDDAIASFTRALELAPDNPETDNAIGTTLRDMGRLTDAQLHFRRAIQTAPGELAAYVNLGNVLVAAGSLDEAETNYRQAIRINPRSAEAHNNLGSLLNIAGRLRESVASFRNAIAAAPDFVSARSNILFNLQYIATSSPAEMLAEARLYGEQVARQAQAYVDWPNAKSSVGAGDTPSSPVLRIGFVSGDLRQHPVGNFFEGVLENLAAATRGRLELFVYSNHPYSDEVSERIKTHCHAWHGVSGLTDAALAKLIHGHGVDVLIDLSGHTARTRLPVFAYKPAPIQAAWLGYLGTTGVAAMDFVIADALTLPLEQEANFTEKIYRLPQSYLCFTKPEATSRVNALPALKNSYVTFGCCNNLTKMNDAVVALWAGVLHAVPNSRLYLKAKQFAEAALVEKVAVRFALHGIARERLILQAQVARKDYLNTYHSIDIALDPFPYPGITTTVESLFMGVPVLTLAGSSFLSRQGLGILSNVGLTDWIAGDAKDYVALAVAHANDLPGLAKLRKQLRAQALASPLFDAPRFARHFESALQSMWEKSNHLGNTTASHQHQLTKAPAQISAAQRAALMRLANSSQHQALELQASGLLQEFPESGILWKLLGFARLIQNKSAMTELLKATQLLPNDTDSVNNLAIALHKLGRYEDAVKNYRQSLTINPKQAETLTNLGMSLYELQRNDEAILNYRAAIKIDAKLAKTHFSLGLSLYAITNYAEAESCYHQALAIQPDFASCHNNLGIVYSDQGRIADALASYRRALEVDPQHFSAHSSLLFVYHYSSEHSAAQLLADARSYGASIAAQVSAKFTNWLCESNPQRLRIGIVSGDLRHHPVAFFLESVLANINPAHFELYAYPSHSGNDQVTARLKQYFRAWKPLLALDDKAAAQLIHADGIHILFDLSGHTANTRLPMFAWKPAPIQVSWLGYLGTSGVAEIDYVLGDPYATPVEDKENYSETIWQMPETYCCFTPPDVAIEVGALPALANQFVTFGCFNNLAKINPIVVDLWARVLHAVPDSRLFLKAKQLDNQSVRAACIAQFSQLGINADRLILEAVSPRAELLAAYHRIDIALDPFPYTGATTSVEALWMGVPLITLKGDRFIARCGETINQNAGLDYLIAADTDEYVAKAVALASNLPRLVTLRSNLREQVLASPLFDAPRFARNFENAMHQMWAKFQLNRPLNDKTTAYHQHQLASSPEHPTSAERTALTGMFNSGAHVALELRAIELVKRYPDSGFAWKLLGSTQLAQGHDALAALQTAVKLLPNDPEVHNNLGTAFKDAKRWEEAVTHYQTALTLAPNHIETLCNLARTYFIRGQNDLALAAFQQAVAAAPANAASHDGMAIALHAAGRYTEAIVSSRKALEINPRSAEAHCNLGIALQSYGLPAEAIASYQRALAIKPDHAEAHSNLGVSQHANGQLAVAEVSYRNALALKPDYPSCYNNLGNLLCELGRLDEAANNYAQALDRQPDYAKAHSNMIFSRSYLPNQSAHTLLEEARRFGRSVARKAKPYTEWSRRLPADSTAGNRSLRVGFVSADFRQHPVGNFFESVLAALVALPRQANSALDLIAYSNHPRTDEVTERLKKTFHAWHSIFAAADETVAHQIHEDGIDILIDLSGHTANNRLPVFAWKPAPVQATWLGYLGTTGVSAMDFVIADALTLPASLEAHFTEKVCRLPQSYLCFTPPGEANEVRTLPAIRNGYVTFGSFNNLSKMNDAVVAVWARVLDAVPNSRLYLRSKQFADAMVVNAITGRFAARGIDSERLILQPQVARKDYLNAYHELDIALDPFPYPGITTSVESLFMGVPVLSLTGNSFLSRQGLGILSNVGLQQWIASDPDGYVDMAVAHANDLPRLAALRSGLRQQVLASPLFDAPQFAAHFEAALRRMWDMRNSK